MHHNEINWPGLLGVLAAVALALGFLAGAAEAATGGASPTEAGSPTAAPSEPETQPASAPSAGSVSVVSAQISPSKAFYYGVREPRLSFVIASSQPENDLRIDIVDSIGSIVRTLYSNDVAPGTSTTVAWDGSGADGRPVANGHYSFRIAPQSAEAATSLRAARTTDGTLEVALYRYIFPIRGTHTYGDGIGAQRVGHTHQGQDLPAACGTPVVAVRGGRVQFSGYQASAAGYYAVVDGRGTGQDTVYMHMLKPALPAGTQVRTGQVIGYVGDTGDSQGCHLHFELWSAPGWFEGGQFMDPTPFLERIDRYS